MYYGAKNRDGLGQLYSAMQYQQQLRLQKEAEAERKRQLEEQRRQQREANKHSAFGDTLKLIGTVGGAAVGSFTPVGPIGGAAIGSGLADATMAFAPNVGGTQPGADNPYYTPTSDTQKALLAANAGIQFMGQYRDRELKLAARNAADLRRKALEEQGFQATREYVSGGFDAKSPTYSISGNIPGPAGKVDYVNAPSLVRDLKDSGDYTFLTDDDLLLVAAGEAEKLDMFGPTLETMTLQASNLLLQELGKEGASTESVLAELDEGTAPWARQFKKAPRAAQVAAKSDFLKQSRATLAAANAALQEKAESLAEFHQGLADTGNSEAIKSRNALMSLITSQDYRGEGSLPMGFTEEQISSGQIMSDPVLYRKLLSYSGTTNADIQFKAMQGTFGAISTFQNAFSKSELNRIAPSYEYVGGEGGEGAAPAKDATQRVVTDPEVQIKKTDISEKVEENTAERTDVDSTEEEKKAEVADGVSVGLSQLLNLTDDESGEETTPYDQTRNDFRTRQQEKFAKAEEDPDRPNLAAEYLRAQAVNPTTDLPVPVRTGGRPVNLPPEEARANFEAEKEARKTRSRRPGLAAEYQRDLALGEAANEDPPPPPPPESNINRMYEDQSVQKEQQASITAAQTPVSPNVTNLISESMDNAKLALGRKPDPAPAADLTELRAPEVPRPPLAQEDIAYAESDPEPRNPEDNERVDPTLRESRVEALNVVKELNNAFTDLRQKVENSIGEDFDSLNELSPVELRYELNAKQRAIDNLTEKFDELESSPLITKEASGEELTEALREYDDIRQSGGRILTELRLMQGERLVDPVIENKVKKLTERYPELSDAKGGVRRRSAAKTYYETEMRLAGGLNGMLSEINNRLADTDAFAKAGRIEQAQLEYAKAMHLIEEGLDKYRGANYGKN